MATIPRYQELGVQYADLPKVSTALQQARATGFDQLSRSLDRMTAYFQGEAETEVKKKARRYQIENPPTQEQQDLAAMSGQAPKIAGAGSIFQEEYDRVSAYALSTELGLKAKVQLSKIQAKIEAGLPVDAAQLKAEMDDMIDGYSSTISAYDPERSLQFRASMVESSRSVFKSALDLQVKQAIKAKQIEVDETLRGLSPLFRSVFESYGEINVDTKKPVDVFKKTEEIGKEVLIFDQQFPEKGYAKIFYDKRQAELNQFFAEKIMDDSFAENDMVRQSLMSKGELGRYKGLWESMSGEDREAVMQAVSAKIEFKNKSINSFLANEQQSADQVLRQIYMAENVSTQRTLFNTLTGLAASPSTISAARNFIDANVSDGPKQDNLAKLGEINREVQAGTATVEQVVAAQRAGLLTKESAKSFVMTITNPNTAINAGVKVIQAAVNIQREDLPPDIKDADARSVAVKIYNQGSLDLLKFANTPDEKGKYPTRDAIAAQAEVIAKQARSQMKPVFAPVIAKAKQSVEIFLPGSAGIDIANDAQWAALLAKKAKAGVKQSDLGLAIKARQDYLNLLKMMQE